MKKYIIKRLLQLIPILFGITLLTFVLMHTSSVDAVDMMEQNTGMAWTEEQKAAAREELGLDKSVPVQYLNWVGNMLKGDMGTSYISGQPVLQMFLEKLPMTIYLTITSVLMTIALSIPLGILSAVRKNKFTDYFIRILSFIGNSMPGFFVALLLMYLFSLKLGWFPVMGSGQGWKSIVLPTLTLAIAGARARGVRERKILVGSVLKASMLTIVTLLSLSIGSLLGGTAIVESIFMWDGVGKMAVDAILTRDYPVIQVYVVWMAIIYVMVNLATDIIYHYLDPRIRLQENS